MSIPSMGDIMSALNRLDDMAGFKVSTVIVFIVVAITVVLIASIIESLYARRKTKRALANPDEIVSEIMGGKLDDPFDNSEGEGESEEVEKPQEKRMSIADKVRELNQNPMGLKSTLIGPDNEEVESPSAPREEPETVTVRITPSERPDTPITDMIDVVVPTKDEDVESAAGVKMEEGTEDGEALLDEVDHFLQAVLAPKEEAKEVEAPKPPVQPQLPTEMESPSIFDQMQNESILRISDMPLTSSNSEDSPLFNELSSTGKFPALFGEEMERARKGFEASAKTEDVAPAPEVKEEDTPSRLDTLEKCKAHHPVNAGAHKAPQVTKEPQLDTPAPATGLGVSLSDGETFSF